jgi:hypothetical protein
MEKMVCTASMKPKVPHTAQIASHCRARVFFIPDMC